MKRALVLLLFVLSACPARADLTMETKYTTNALIWRSVGRFREQVRDDRSRIETWSAQTTFGQSEPEKHVIEIVRADRGLRWELHPDSLTYEEHPWPDTVQAELEDSESIAERAARDSAQSRLTPKELPRKTGEHRVINGFPAERYFLRTDGDSTTHRDGSEFECWGLNDPRVAEIHRLQRVSTRHSAWSFPRDEGDTPGYSSFEDWAEGDSLVLVRAAMTVAVLDSAQTREMAEEVKRNPPDRETAEKAGLEDFDLATGKMTMIRMDVTSIQLGKLPDATFEVPKNYKKIVRRHSPR